MKRTSRALLVIITAATLGYGHLWWRGEVAYSPHSDWMSYFLSAMTLVHDSIEAGEGVPLWRGDQMTGSPALTNPVIPYTYPPFVLFWFVEPNTAVGIAYWLHFALAGAAFYAFGRALGLGASALWVVTLAGMFNFKLLLTVYAGWLPYVPTLCLIPFLFACVFSLMRRPRPSAALAFAATAALCLVAGWVQLLYYASIALAAFVVVSVVQMWREDRSREAVRAVSWLAGGSVLALGLTATAWLPLIGEAPLLSRSQPSYDFFLGSHPIGLVHLATFFFPELLGTPVEGSYDELWEDVAYFGAIPLLLATLGATFGWRRRFTPYLAAGFVVSVGLAIDSPLLRALWTCFPGFDLFRMPSRFLYMAGIFGIALSGVGLDEVRARVIRNASGKKTAAAALTVLCVAGIVVEGTYYSRRYLTTLPKQQLVPDSEIHDWLARDTSLHRIAPTPRSLINYGWSAPLGLEMVTGYDPYNFRHYQDYFDILQFGETRKTGMRVWTDLGRVRRFDLLDALNVKYIVAGRALEPPAGRFDLAATFRDQPTFAPYGGFGRSDVYVYRNERVLPRVFWVGRVIGATDEDDALRALVRHNVRDTAVVVDPPPGALTSADPTASVAASIQIIPSPAGRVEIETGRDRAGYAVISEVWHPGWTASLDGEPIDLHRTDVALLGAWIPAGRHRLVARFEPLFWTASLWITSLSGLAFALLLGRELARAR
ncbi:MAG: DUF6541 family protein [Myxococcota bacterium]